MPIFSITGQGMGLFSQPGCVYGMDEKEHCLISGLMQYF
jgi:hypothetical protein